VKPRHAAHAFTHPRCLPHATSISSLCQNHDGRARLVAVLPGAKKNAKPTPPQTTPRSVNHARRLPPLARTRTLFARASSRRDRHPLPSCPLHPLPPGRRRSSSSLFTPGWHKRPCSLTLQNTPLYMARHTHHLRSCRDTRHFHSSLRRHTLVLSLLARCLALFSLWRSFVVPPPTTTPSPGPLTNTQQTLHHKNNCLITIVLSPPHL
jgi:hypothetical protein